MRALALAALLLSVSTAQAAWVEQPGALESGGIGLLLLARPGTMAWETACRDAADELEADGRVRLVFGPDDFKAVQKAVSELELSSGRILAVPLGLSKGTNDFELFRYYAGIAERLFQGAASSGVSFPGGKAPRLQAGVPLVMTPGMEEMDVAGAMSRMLKPYMRTESPFSIVLLGFERDGLQESALAPFLSKIADDIRQRNGLYASAAFVLRGRAPDRMDKTMSGDQPGQAAVSLLQKRLNAPLRGDAQPYQGLRGRIRELAPVSKVLVAGYAPED
ncbi:MAG: hypothetical protein GX410_08605, partial [Elusimicrobia bacterium]|nr:hypothetical protein [Elusimicrobiota bacterium]